MATIRADLSLMTVAEFLTWLRTQDVDGVLTVDSGISQFTFSVSQGAIVRAQTNTKDLSLGQFLIASQTVAEDTMRKALQSRQQTQHTTNQEDLIPIGEYLIQKGFISEEELKEAVITQIREVLFEATTWKTGVLVFERDKLRHRSFAAPASESLESLCRLIQHRQDQWQNIRRVIKDKKARLEIGHVSSESTYQLDHLEDRILSYAAFGMTIEAICLEIRGPVFQIYHRLSTLTQLGFITIIDAAVDEPPTLDLPVQEENDGSHEEKAVLAYDSGDYRLAISYAKVCLARAPDNARAKHIIHDSDRLLQEQLRSLLPSLDAIPHKLMTTTELRERRRVSAKEHYLLTRINGVRTIESIVRIAPMRDIDAYKLFEQLKNEGVIRFSLG